MPPNRLRFILGRGRACPARLRSRSRLRLGFHLFPPPPQPAPPPGLEGLPFSPPARPPNPLHFFLGGGRVCRARPRSGPRLVLFLTLCQPAPQKAASNVIGRNRQRPPVRLRRFGHPS